MSVYGALELKASYQRNLGIGLIFSVFSFGSFLAALLVCGGRLPDVINEVKSGTIIVLPVPKAEPKPKTPATPTPQPPAVSQPKLGVLVPDSFFPPEIFDQPSAWPENREPLNGTSEANNTTDKAGIGASGDTVIDLEPDGLKPVILHKVKPEYPALARQRGITETVVAELVVGADGFVREVLIRKPSTEFFDEEVKSALRQWIFRPLVVDGRVVKFRYLEVVRFSLR